MHDSIILSGFDGASQLDLWILWLKVMATGIAAVLLCLLAVFAVSLRRSGQPEWRVAFHFTLASLFATLYIGADAAVRINVAVGNIDAVILPYRFALSAVVLSIAAYINLYWRLLASRAANPRRSITLYGVAVLSAGLIWFSHPALIVSSDRIALRGTAVYADYGALAPLFFGLCLLLFAAVSVALIRLAYRVAGTTLWLMTVLGFLVLLLAGVHDALRELGVFAFPVGTLPLGYALFQVGAFAVLAIHYSRILQDRQHQGLQLRRLTDAVARDGHSGLFTRTYLENTLNAPGVAARGGLLFIDLDHFKGINDRFGHLCGDELIRAVADRIRSNMRDQDIPCRWGGDEFVVYLPGIEWADLMALSERLQQTFRDIRLEQADKAVVSVSMGFAELTDADWHQTLERADQAMYEAKQAGRNRLMLARGVLDGAPQPMRANALPD